MNPEPPGNSSAGTDDMRIPPPGASDRVEASRIVSASMPAGKRGIGHQRQLAPLERNATLAQTGCALPLAAAAGCCGHAVMF